jgi:hypothetical protein
MGSYGHDRMVPMRHTDLYFSLRGHVHRARIDPH